MNLQVNDPNPIFERYAFDDAVPVGGVGESAVLEHDGRLLALVLVCGRGGTGRGPAEREHADRDGRSDQDTGDAGVRLLLLMTFLT
jgi:hypothetical protein